MRLSASGKGFHRIYFNQAQEVFLDGHVRAFAHFGGVPRRIRYDNLKPAVVRVMKGRGRIETERFIAMRSHYGFESFFCLPGVKGAHEKGGVEGEVGRFRRRHMVPVPNVGSLDALNDLVAIGDERDDHRHIEARRMTVAQHFAAELPLLSVLARRSLRRGPRPQLPGRHQEPDLRAPVLLFGPGPLCRSTDRRPPRCRSRQRARRSWRCRHASSGRRAKGPRSSNSITTSRSSPSSPVPWPAPVPS